MFKEWMQAEKFRKIPPTFLRYGIRHMTQIPQIQEKPNAPRILNEAERFMLLKTLTL